MSFLRDLIAGAGLLVCGIGSAQAVPMVYEFSVDFDRIYQSSQYIADDYPFTFLSSTESQAIFDSKDLFFRITIDFEQTGLWKGCNSYNIDSCATTDGLSHDFGRIQNIDSNFESLYTYNYSSYIGSHTSTWQNDGYNGYQNNDLYALSIFYSDGTTSAGDIIANGIRLQSSIHTQPLGVDVFGIGSTFTTSVGKNYSDGYPRKTETFFGVATLTNISSVSVPEPASIALMGLGLVGLGFARRKKAA
jgi:hypothetical protein